MALLASQVKRREESLAIASVRSGSDWFNSVGFALDLDSDSDLNCWIGLFRRGLAALVSVQVSARERDLGLRLRSSAID